jgi:hypothetical protein
MANIADFKAQLIGGGARPNQFRVDLTFPSYVTLGAIAGLQGQFLCKATTLPSSTIENIAMQYRGRQINFAGERTFDQWNVTIYNDTSFNIRNAIEQWQAGIQNYAATTGRTNPRDYQVDLDVHQLDRNGASIKSYKFTDAYPTNIGAIALDYEQQNQIETFDIEFTYNYFTSNSTEGNSVNVNVSVDTPIGNFPIPIGR